VNGQPIRFPDSSSTKTAGGSKVRHRLPVRFILSLDGAYDCAHMRWLVRRDQAVAVLLSGHEPERRTLPRRRRYGGATVHRLRCRTPAPRRSRSGANQILETLTRVLRRSILAQGQQARCVSRHRGSRAASAHGPYSRTGQNEHPIRTLQHLLRARGHNVAADGKFGPGTEAAVKAFQTSKNLSVDGVWSALRRGRPWS
jgi:hypothetical protein